MADLQKVISTLKENKVDDKSIAGFVLELNNFMSAKVYTELISALDSEEEMSRLDKLPEDQMRGELVALYREKTGKDIAVVSEEILDGFVTGFLTEYHKQKLAEKKS